MANDAPATSSFLPYEHSSPLRILFVGAEPRSEARTGWGHDLRAIYRALRQLPPSKTQVYVAAAATLMDFSNELIRHRPHIVHISAHGSQSGGILFEHDKRGHELVSGATIANILGMFDDLRLVILATEGALDAGRTIGEQGTPSIAFTSQLHIDHSNDFSEAFYPAIAAGMPLQQAFELARITRRARGRGGQPILFSPESTPDELASFTIVTSATPAQTPNRADIEDAVAQFFNSIGGSLAITHPPITGSFMQRFWGLFKRGGELNHRLREVEEAIVARGRDIPKSQAFSEYALALERIMASVGGADSPERVAVLFETLLVLRFPGVGGESVVVCKQLSLEEQRRITRDPALMASPQKLLEALVEHGPKPLPASPMALSD